MVNPPDCHILLHHLSNVKPVIKHRFIVKEMGGEKERKGENCTSPNNKTEEGNKEKAKRKGKENDKEKEKEGGGGGRVVMLLVKYRSIEDAVETMCLMHNTNVKGFLIRLSFSKSNV